MEVKYFRDFRREQKEFRTEIEKATKYYFKKTIKLNSEGSYKVCPPWIISHALLS